MHFKLEIVTRVIVLFYAVYFSFKHMMANNNKGFKKIYAFFVFISAMWLIAHRDTYLPFLGYTALPPTAIKESLLVENANTEISVPFINMKDGTRVIFWGAKPAQETQPNPQKAYSDYTNIGITSVRNGAAVLRFNCPARYKVGPGYTLPRHIHYRCVLDNGLITPVRTKEVVC
jgi:hypothetical protein